MPITKPYDPDMFAPGFRNLGTPTKGSVIAGNGSTWQKLGVGANGTVLTANSGETTGLEWAAGGGSSSENWTATVANLADLNAALTNGARVLITASLALSGVEQINLPTTGSVTIGATGGVTISHSGAVALFNLASGTCKLRWVDNNNPEGNPTFDLSGGGTLFASSGTLNVEANRINLATGGSTTIGGSGIIAEISQMILEASDAGHTISENFSIGLLKTTGGGSSASFSAAGSVETFNCEATLRSYTANNSATTFGVRVGTSVGDSAWVGLLFGSGLTASTLVLAANLGILSAVDTAGKIAASSGGCIERGGVVTDVIFTNNTSAGVIRNTYIDNGITEETSAAKNILEYCQIEGTNTIASTGFRCKSCRLVSGHSLTISSGAGSIINDLEIAGTLTIDSGAAARVTNSLDGSGTLTNNDPLSIVTGSDDVAWDTTPATRRFGNATLDAPAVLQSLVGYYRLDESIGESFRNTAPFGPGSPMSITGAFTEEDVLGDGMGIDFADGVYCSVSSDHFPWGSRAPFAISLVYTFDAAPGSNKVIAALTPGAGTTGIDIELTSSRRLQVYCNGSYIISGATVLSTATVYHIVLERYWSGAAWTFRLWINGVSEGTSTTNATSFDIASCVYFFIGRWSASPLWSPGGIAHISHWSRQLDSSLVSALYNSGTIRTLQGAVA